MSDLEKKIDKYFPFEIYRNGQKEIIYDIITKFQDNDYYVLEAPTGSGKSVIAYTVAKYMLNEVDIGEIPQPYSVICTSTKYLQYQYITSFQNLDDISFIWSAKNYDCILYPPTTSEEEVHYGDPLCPGMKCKHADECPYLVQKDKFHNHPIGISNYHYFLNYRKLTPYLTIMDECHNLENLLCDMASISISKFGLVKLANNILKNSKYVKPKSIPVEYFSKKIEKLAKSNSIIDDSVLYINDFFQYFKPVLIEISKELDEARELLSRSKSKSLM
ncbi:MAG: DEAD/DEAH box helicase family protein [Nanoarchaeota archaeon]